ncbi:unnamed protein product [Amoebophrya sp. A25]|nr:unnamed protein product [Amoebophrya sp. A25]|eukprot:GSA25T00014529001.1
MMAPEIAAKQLEMLSSSNMVSVLTNSEAGSTSTQDPTTIPAAGNKVDLQNCHGLEVSSLSTGKTCRDRYQSHEQNTYHALSSSFQWNKSTQVLASPYKSSNRLSSRLMANGAKNSTNFKSASSASKKVKRARARARQRLESEAKQAAPKQAAGRRSAFRSAAVKSTSRAHLHRKAAPSKKVLNIQRGSAGFGSAALLLVQQVQGPQRVFVLGLQQDAQHGAALLQQGSFAIDGQAEAAEISTSITSSEENSAKTKSPNLRGSMTFRRTHKQAKSPSLGDDGSKVQMENDNSSKMSSMKSPNLRGTAVFLQEQPSCGKGSSFCGCAQDELESVQMLSTANPKEKTALRDLCKFERWSLKKNWDSMTRRLGLGEGACVKNLAVGAYIFRYNDMNWLTSYTPEAQSVDFHALPEEYTDIIQSKAGSVQWSHILDEYRRLLALSKSSKSMKPVVKPLPSMYSARNGLEVVFSLGLTMKIPNDIKRLCEDVAQSAGNSKAIRPVLWLLRRFSKNKSGATSTQLQETCSRLLPKVRDLIAEGAQAVAQKTAVLFFPTGAADSRRFYASLTEGALGDFNDGERGATKDDEAAVAGLSRTEMAIRQDMKAQTLHLVNTAVSEDGSSASSSCCGHCGVAGVYDRLARLLFQSGAGAWYRGQAASSFLMVQPGGGRGFLPMPAAHGQDVGGEKKATGNNHKWFAISIGAAAVVLILIGTACLIVYAKTGFDCPDPRNYI